MRANDRAHERASASARVVLPTPGTSSRSRWPRATRQVTESCAWVGLPSTTRERLLAMRSIASRADFGFSRGVSWRTGWEVIFERELNALFAPDVPGSEGRLGAR